MKKSINIKNYIKFLIKEINNRNIKILPIFTATNSNMIYLHFIENYGNVILWDDISSNIYYLYNRKESIYYLNDLIILLQNTQLQLLLICRLLNVEYNILHDTFYNDLIKILFHLIFIIDNNLDYSNIFFENIEIVANIVNEPLFIKYKRDYLDFKNSKN